MNRGGAIAAALLLISSPSITSAALVQAVYTGVSTLSPCPSYCGGAGAVFASDQNGGVGLTSSYSSLSTADGNGQAQADLNGSTELPVLRAQAFSQSNSSASAQAVGMQGFYYDGSGSGTYQLDIMLAGIANNPSLIAVDGGLSASVVIFRDTDPSTDVDFSVSYGTLKFEIIPLTGDLELLADAGMALQITPDNVQHTVSTTLSVSGLNAGDLLYVWASVGGGGTRGGFGDGFDTLTLQFQDASGLSHTPVPIPGACAMFAPALLLIARRRRQ